MRVKTTRLKKNNNLQLQFFKEKFKKINPFKAVLQLDLNS